MTRSHSVLIQTSYSTLMEIRLSKYTQCGIFNPNANTLNMNAEKLNTDADRVSTHAATLNTDAATLSTM